MLLDVEPDFPAKNIERNLWPSWIPDSARLYLEHIETGCSLRALARREGVHASTILRLVRRTENRRDDPLVDAALAALGPGHNPSAIPYLKGDKRPMSAPIRSENLIPDEATLRREGRRVLRRLAEPGAVLVIAPDLEKAVVLREIAGGQSTRTAVVERVVAQAFALKEWIAPGKAIGRIARYELTPTGRASLKRMISEDEGLRAAPGMAEAMVPFAAQHQELEEREIDEDGGPRRMRYNLAESPVALLGRRREKDGRPFLEPEWVAAAERLREDFELAQMGPRVAQNWERFLTGADRGSFRPDSGLAEGPRNARDRVALALAELGPGLGDVALRVCCFLEGIETAERRMGWAARSGKIVLRIALQRLRSHYDRTYGRSGPLIG